MTGVTGVMPPEPPPAMGESDYSQRHQAAPATVSVGTSGAFGVDDIPIPAHLLSQPATPELNAAWAAVLMDEHDPVPKRGYNTYFKYNYATADDIRMFVAKVLGKNGLYYEQHTAGFTPWVGPLVRVTYYFVVRHASGQCSPPIRYDELAKTTGDKGGPDDKALGKASVLALKNFSKVSFSIDTGDLEDDPDADGPVVEPVNQLPARPASSRSAAPAAKQAFRNAGLPPKAPLANGHAESPPDPETGDAGDDWLSRTLHALTAGPLNEEWLRILKTAYDYCPSATAAGAIDKTPMVVKVMAAAKPDTKKRIEEWRTAALRRLATPAVVDESAEQSA